MALVSPTCETQREVIHSLGGERTQQLYVLTGTAKCKIGKHLDVTQMCVRQVEFKYNLFNNTRMLTLLGNVSMLAKSDSKCALLQRSVGVPLCWDPKRRVPKTEAVWQLHIVTIF